MKIKKILFKITLFAIFVGGSFTSFSQNEVAYARKVIDTLASPRYDGRGYIENGDKLASAFIAGEFKKSGLIPLNKGSYFQPFDLSVNTFPGKMVVKLNDELLIPGADYLIQTTSPSVHGKFNVISVTRSDINTSDKLNQIISKAHKSFILIDNRRPANESMEDQKIINDNIEILKTEKDLNFKGLIIFSYDKLTWTTLTYQEKRPVIIINKKDFDPSKIHTIQVDVDAVFVPKYTTRNVVGMIKGTLNVDSTIVITAHYDHLGQMGKGTYFPGANDNASGTSMMLCFVKYYAAHPPKYNTVFIAFSGEEIGLLGSEAFVENPLADLSKIKFLVNFDLAGTGDEGIKVVNGSIFKNQFNLLVKLNDEYKLLPKIEERGEACISDHCRFYRKGVPSFFIYTLGGIAAYHDIYDRSETLPLTEFENYFELMVKFFAAI
ncbi:MAG: M28 family peptidase [Ginsengibacter sp.]